MIHQIIQGKFNETDEHVLLELLYRVMGGQVRRMDAELVEAKIKISCYRLGEGIRLDILPTKEGV